MRFGGVVSRGPRLPTEQEVCYRAGRPQEVAHNAARASPWGGGCERTLGLVTTALFPKRSAKDLSQGGRQLCHTAGLYCWN